MIKPTIFQNFLRFCGASVLIGAAFSGQAMATNSANLTCAGIGASYSYSGGSGTSFFVTLADGDTLTATAQVDAYTTYAVFNLYSPKYMTVGTST